MAIIGQDKLLNKINSYTIDSLPRTIAIIGEKGSGKSLLCGYIAEKFNLKYIDWKGMKKEQAYEAVDGAGNSIGMLYRFDAKDLAERNNEKAQVLLKLLEEPPSGLFIVITADNKSQLITTVINRCQIWQLEKYSKETLKEFTADERVLEIAKTPGQCLKLTISNLDDMVAYINKIYDAIHLAALPNALKIADRIAYKEGEEGFDFDLFVDLCIKVSYNKIVENSEYKYVEYYKLTNQLANDRYIFNVDKRKLVETFVIKLKEIAC